MKAKSILSLCGASAHRQSNIALAVAIAALFANQAASAADVTWEGNTNDSVNEATNWVGGALPNNTAAAADRWVFGTAGSAGSVLTGARNFGGMLFNANAPAYTIGTTANNVIWQVTSSTITNNSENTQTINYNLAMGAARRFTGTGDFIANGALTGNGNISKRGTGNLTITGTANTLSNSIIVEEGGTLTLGAVGDVGARNFGIIPNSDPPVERGNFSITNATFAAAPGVVTAGGNSSIQQLTMNTGSKFTMADGVFNTFEVSITANLFNTTGTAPVFTFNLGGESSADVLDLAVAPGFAFAGPKIEITPVTPLTIGNSYTVITAPSGLDDPNGFVLGSGIAVLGNIAYSLSITNSATSTSIGVVSADLARAYYSGTQGSTLNAGTPGVSSNWQDAETGGADTIIQPTPVTEMHFTATGATNTTIDTLGQDYSVFSINFNDNAGPVTINDSGSNKLTLGADGINVTAGSHTINVPLELSTAQTFTNNGTLALGGTINNGGANLIFSGSGDSFISGVISGAGALSKTGTGSVTLSAANDYTGGLTVQSGLLTLENDQSAATGSIFVGPALTADSNLTIAADSTVTLGSERVFQVGNTGTGGLNSISATTSVSGSVTNAGALYVGRLGTLNLNDGATWVQTGDMTVQGAGNLVANMLIGSGASLTYNGPNTIKVQPPTGDFGGVSRLTVTGTLTTSQGFEAVNDATGNATGQVVLNNGTLVLAADLPSLFLADGAGDATKISVLNTGTIDTNSFDAEIAQIITGSGGLTKNGGGTLTLSAANTYVGITTVSGGILAINGDSLNDLSALDIAGGMVAVSGDETVQTLAFDGVAQSAGTWGSSSSSPLPDFQDDTRFSGTGVVTVTGAPVTDPYIAWIDSFTPNALLPDEASKLPGTDPDGDGITNLMEFVLGGSPVVSSQAILPTQAIVGSDVVLSYKRSDESEAVTTQVGQWSTNLSTWTDVTPVLVNENDAAPDDMTVTVPTSNEDAGKLFLRLKVVK